MSSPGTSGCWALVSDYCWAHRLVSAPSRARHSAPGPGLAQRYLVATAWSLLAGASLSSPSVRRRLPVEVSLLVEEADDLLVGRVSRIDGGQNRSGADVVEGVWCASCDSQEVGAV